MSAVHSRSVSSIFVLGGLLAGPVWSQTVRSGGSAQEAAPVRRGLPPVISTSLDSQSSIPWSTVVRFTVSVTDPDGDPVTLRMLKRPPGLDFDPPVDEPTPWSREVTWNTSTLIEPGMPEVGFGPSELVFEAVDGVSGIRTRHSVRVSIEQEREARTRIGDVTGDGTPDVVAAALRADVGGVVDAGAVHVWVGGPDADDSPSATLTVAGAGAGSKLGSSLELRDVSGDGILDIIATEPGADPGGVEDAGALAVWYGGAGLATSDAPDARLVVEDAHPGDSLGNAAPFFADVTGDGQVDVIVRAPYAESGGWPYAGEVYVWEGGASLAGTLSPLARLRSPQPEADTDFGRVYGAIAILTVDLNADGVLDLLIGDPHDDVDGVIDRGTVWFWAGGPALSGTPVPDASLGVPDGIQDDHLGFGSHPFSYRTADVTGDGLVDVIVSSARASYELAPGSPVVHDAVGRIYVWAGSPDFSGVRAPTATLALPTPRVNETLGASGARIADVTGDGVLDVIGVAPGRRVDEMFNVGAVYVWEGGPGLKGYPAACAELRAPVPVAGARLGGERVALELADVNGDSILDIVTAASGDAAAGQARAGAVYVWSGGASLSGSPAPLARLTASTPVADDRLGAADLVVADVTGDGALDVLVGSTEADLQRGRIHVFEGGAALEGSAGERARLEYHDTDTDRGDFARAFDVADVTGDGCDDVVASRGGNAEEPGTIMAWQGGAGLAGEPLEAHLLAGHPSAHRFDMRGLMFFRDLDGDGILDLLSGSQVAEVDGRVNAGMAFVWYGRARLVDTLPSQVLRRTNPAPNDRLGRAEALGAVFGDVTGDGILDVLIGASKASIAGVPDAGAIHLWSGTAGPGTPPADAFFRVSAPAAGDELGG